MFLVPFACSKNGTNFVIVALAMNGYGRWFSIKKNLPLDYWSRCTFEAIGSYFGGLENIVSDENWLLLALDDYQKIGLSEFFHLYLHVHFKTRGRVFLGVIGYDAIGLG